MSLYQDIRNRFGLPLSTTESNGHYEYQFKCPFCIDRVGKPDKSGHLFVRSDNGVYHCYRCDAAGAINPSKHAPSVDDKLLMELMESYLNDSVSEVEDDNPYPYLIPSRSIFNNSIAYNYMTQRGFNDDDLHFYDVRVGDIMTQMIGRVVIPNEVKDNCWTDMYTARTFVGHDRRYMNPKGSSSGCSVFNLSRIPENPDQIILCEGPITAMAAGRDAVALYGKLINPVKIRRIINKKPKSIVVNLDPDAEHVAVKLAELCRRMDADCVVKLMINPTEYKDAADYLKAGRINEYRDRINSSEVFDSLIYKAERGTYHNEQRNDE